MQVRQSIANLLSQTLAKMCDIDKSWGVVTAATEIHTKERLNIKAVIEQYVEDISVI